MEIQLNEKDNKMVGLFYENGVYGKNYMLRIGDVESIRDQLAHINDWMCLVNMGKTMGSKSDQPKLKKLQNFLCTCVDREMLENFNIKISTGEVGCIMCAETVDELEKMKKIILSAPEINTEHHKKIISLFDWLNEYLSTGESDHVLFNKISARQYITTGIVRDDYLD